MKKKNTFQSLVELAKKHDKNDPLQRYVGLFYKPTAYDCTLVGNSLGLLTVGGKDEILRQLTAFKRYGHGGHFATESNWWQYHKKFNPYLQRFLGSQEDEAVVMGSLSENINKLLLEFLRKIVDEHGSDFQVLTTETFFTSDLWALDHSLRIVLGKRYTGNPSRYIVRIPPDKTGLYSTQTILKTIEKHAKIRLVFLPAVCHVTGQVFNIQSIIRGTRKKLRREMYFGLDLAHAVGNIPLSLSKWGVDFAAACSYKYCSGGPGGVGLLYVRKKHHKSISPAGWWGIDEQSRFGLFKNQRPAKGVARMMVSNDPVFNMCFLLGFFRIFDEYSETDVFLKHQKIQEYTAMLLEEIAGITVITPKDAHGAQTSFTVEGYTEVMVNVAVHTLQAYVERRKYTLYIEHRGDVFRVAPTAATTYSEVATAMKMLKKFFQSK